MHWAVVSLVIASVAAERPIDRILESGDFQRELPDVAAAPSDPSPSYAPSASKPTVRAPPAPSAAVGAAVGWIALAAILLLLVAWAVSAWRGRSPRAPNPTTAPAPRPALAAEPPEDATAGGDYALAIQRLFLRALGRLGSRAPLPRSATAWEIVNRTTEPELREPLAGLVRGVEAVRWALTPVGAKEFEECAGHFRTLSERLDRLPPSGPRA